MTCRLCGGGSFGEVIDLGQMPLVNRLLGAPEDDCPTWPLRVVHCCECGLVQLAETPPPPAMFDEYLYFSSQSRTMVDHAARLVQRFVKPDQRVVEIASNDGYLLKQAMRIGATVQGVDPAANIAEYARAQGVPTRCEYFDEQCAAAMVSEWGQADVLFANNVLAHVPEPHRFATGIKVLLAAQGVAHIEVPSLQCMMSATAFDTIYHEHQCYFSCTTLQRLFHECGLRIVGVEQVNIHGGSLHLSIMHQGDELGIEAHVRSERDLGLHTEKTYRNFEERVCELKRSVTSVCEQFPHVAACGAAAKGIVLLNVFGLDRDRVRFVTDASLYKQGRFVPGTKQPIVPPARLVDEMPDAALILPWNIQDEIMDQQSDYHRRGGRFIVPIPETRII